jgi:hypothetical protein
MKPSRRRRWMFQRFDAVFTCDTRWFGAMYLPENKI